MVDLPTPTTDPTPIFELFRGSYGTELLTAAITEFGLFGRLADGAKPQAELQREMELEARPMCVLMTAMRAMGLIADDGAGGVALTPVAREHLVPGGPFDVSGYVGLAKGSPGVRTMIERLRTNRPAGQEEPETGTAFIFRPDVPSAMERHDSARALTMALVGRARNVAPVLAQKVSLASSRCILDVGGGSGIYSIAWLLRHEHLRAIVWDRPEVLRVAEEFAHEFGVADRLECVAGDMFNDAPPPGADICLLSNVLHDWDVPECRQLLARCSSALPSGGALVIHDVLLNDAHDGPLAVALYSAALFCQTEGRAYSAAEYREWLEEGGFAYESTVSTLVHCSAILAQKR